ncbi:flagellar basal body-associated protein FliL [Cypionkella aquatica]|nr:flagellar basal body-associated protein FliL [Cypionkella aquatica]
MIRKLIPVLLGLIGLGIGLGAGLFLRPAGHEVAKAEGAEASAAESGHGAEADEEHAAPKEGADHATTEHVGATETEQSETSEAGPEYIKLSNQFVIPVVEKGKVVSMVIIALTLEAGGGTGEEIYAREPKLRDGFLQVLFDHANSGGFNGSFTDGANLVLLRRALLESAQTVIGPNVTDVLISDIARQDS